MMHSDQVHIDTAIARQMIADQFPQYRDETVRRLGATGTDNAIFRIGMVAAARFPLRAGDPVARLQVLRAEAAAMTEFAEHCRVPAPRPLGLGRPGPLYPMPWSVQSWVDGDVATPDGCAVSLPFARDIAELIASLRSAGTRGRRFEGSGRGGHLPDHDRWIEVCLANSEGLLDVPRLRGLWSRFRELPAPAPEVMSHGDLIPANLLVRGERLVGVLDGGGFGPADPALDLVAAWHHLDHEGREAIRARLGSDDVEWQRGAAWAFQQAIGLVWYYRTSNPAMSALGRSTLTRILDATDI